MQPFIITEIGPNPIDPLVIHAESPEDAVKQFGPCTAAGNHFMTAGGRTFRVEPTNEKELDRRRMEAERNRSYTLGGHF